MTKKKLIIFLIFLSSNLIFSQRFMEEGGWHLKGGKIEQLEKIKLIEVLQLDEETTLKFFSRRNLHQQSQKHIILQRDSILTKLADQFNSENKTDYKIGIEKILKIDKELLDDREKFLRSLNDLLSAEQIAKLLVFEIRFRSEIRKQILIEGKQRKGRMPPFD